MKRIHLNYPSIPDSDFICKYELYIKDTASFYYHNHEGNFTIKAEITTLGSNPFDAAFIMVRQNSYKKIDEIVTNQGFSLISNLVHH